MLGLTCLAIGGFVLPGNPAPGTAKPAPSPVALHTEPTAPPPRLELQAPPPATEAPAATRSALSSDLLATAPKVLPQLPAGGGPLDVAVAIDREVDRSLTQAGVPASPVSSDAEFVRRAYLDVTGHIPDYEKTVAFLDSPDPYKRSRLVDELLASPEYGEHFAHIWTDLLVKRDFDNNKNLRSDAFTGWLAGQFNAGRAWDKIVADLLTAEGKEEQVPQTFFFLANQDENQPAANKLVGAAGNLFMGIQIQCAECHVHPFTSKWDRKDFWGLAAFFGHTRAEREGGGKGKKNNGPATIVEADKRPEVPRGKGSKKDNGKPFPAGATIGVPDPTMPKRILQTVSAKFFEGAQPKLGASGPYRPTLAGWLASSQNRYFAPAAVNRMWAHFFARGLVNPIEDMNDDNPPSHPALLKLLADEFVRSGYDLKFLVRAICNSRAYQRTSRPLPGNQADEKLLSHVAVKVISAQMLLDSLATATGHRDANTGGPVRQRLGKKGGGPVSEVRFFDQREYDEDPTEFSYGIPQVLRLMNSNLSGSSAEVANRLARQPGGDRPKVIEDIYLIALSRRPNPAENQRMLEFVAKQAEANKGYAGIFWALLNSAEFISNH